MPAIASLNPCIFPVREAEVYRDCVTKGALAVAWIRLRLPELNIGPHKSAGPSWSASLHSDWLRSAAYPPIASVIGAAGPFRKAPDVQRADMSQSHTSELSELRGTTTLDVAREGKLIAPNPYSAMRCNREKCDRGILAQRMLAESAR